jgi:hypothetical protein
LKGHEFIRADKDNQFSAASAAEGRFSPIATPADAFFSKLFSRAKSVDNRPAGLSGSIGNQTCPQWLKPGEFFDLCGTTEVVPFQNSKGTEACSTF